MKSNQAFVALQLSVCLASCSDREEAIDPEGFSQACEISRSIDVLDDKLPERQFLGLDPSVSTGIIWDQDLTQLGTEEDPLRTLVLLPSLFELEGAASLRPVGLLESFELPRDAIESALRSRNYGLVRIALEILDQHAIPLKNDDRTAEEIIAVFLSANFELRDQMNREMEKRIWYFSPSHPGHHYYEIDEALRMRDVED